MSLSIDPSDFVPADASDLLVLRRFCYGPPEVGTFGTVEVAGHLLYTVEPSWLDNEVAASCIPEGIYDCKPTRYHRGGYPAIEVVGVPGRSRILFHRANSAKDLAGCIAPGMRLGTLYNSWAVLASAAAFSILMRHYGDRGFRLEITFVYGLTMGWPGVSSSEAR